MSAYISLGQVKEMGIDRFFAMGNKEQKPEEKVEEEVVETEE